MIEIDGVIISTDIFTEPFCCDLGHCKGICCVEGNSGAPLEEQECGILEKEYQAYKPFLKPEGIKSLKEQGFFVLDDDGDLTTPLINDAECAYSYQQDGLTLCAVERAWLEGATGFRKPVSCHLYPIRVMKFSNGTIGLNYHRWDVCSGAVACGRAKGIPVYKALREPLINFLGEEFYKKMETAASLLAEVPPGTRN